MKTRGSLVLGSFLVLSTFCLGAVACGGAVDPGIGSSSGSSGSSGGSSSGSSGTPTPTTTSTSVPPSPPMPQPSPFMGTWSGTASGCANFTVYAADTSAPRYLIIRASKAELGLGALGSTATIDLANTSGAPSTDIGVDTYSEPPADPYCTDVISSPPPTFTHARATSGTATFTVTGVGRDDGTYEISVTLKGLTVLNSMYGELEPIPEITFTKVNVGWLPG